MPVRSYKPTIRRLLIQLVLACHLLALLAGAGVVYLGYLHQRSEMTQETVDKAAWLARTLRGRIEDTQAALNRLGTLVPASGDLADFHRSARTLAAELQADAIVLIRPSGKQVVNSFFELRNTPARVMPSDFTEVFRTGKPAVVNLLMSPVSNTQVIAMGVPINRDGRPAYALFAILDAHRLQALVEQIPVPASWIVAIVDGNGRIAARSPLRNHLVGRKLPESLQQNLEGQAFGTFEGVTLDGTPAVAAYHTLPSIGWSAIVSIPQSEFYAAAQRAAAMLAASLALMLAISLAGALWLQRKLVRSIWQLRDAASTLSTHDSEMGSLAFREADELGEALKKTAHTVEASRYALSRSERQLAGILHTARSAIVVTDAQGRIQMFNAAAETIFGYSQPRVLGRPLHALFTEEGWVIYSREAEASTGCGDLDEVRSTTAQCMRFGHIPFPAEFSVSATEDADGQRIFIVLLRDITARVQAQEALLAAHRELDELNLRFERMLFKESDLWHAEIARELHDSVGSALTGIAMLLQSARCRMESPRAVETLLDKMQEQLKLASERVRQLARGILPAGEEAGALRHALEQYASDVSEMRAIHCGLRARGDFSDIPASAAGHVFRIVQEAVTNAVRHGRARSVQIRLFRAGHQCGLTVRDDGDGCDFSLLPLERLGLGLKSMQARARALDGTLVLRGRCGHGCIVRLRWPAQPRKALVSDDAPPRDARLPASGASIHPSVKSDPHQS